MTTLIGSCIIAQSGGPTAVINASTYGTIKKALDETAIIKVYGAANGIEGVLNDRLYDMGLEDRAELNLLKYTPAAALGSCRYKMKDCNEDDTDYRQILNIFKKYNVRYFFYNGGNDSMDTCNKISNYMDKVGYQCRIIGVPKTIDNDLAGTDHCPGYGSAAKYIATTCMELFCEKMAYMPGTINIVEIMGRNAGWLTAAAALATYQGAGPDLIYLPELAFDIKQFLADIEAVYKKKGNVLIAVSEGIRDSNGTYISGYGVKTAEQKDAFGHAQMGGLAATLAAIVKEKTGTKVRGIELSLLQRCAAHIASAIDIEEAYLAGRIAVERAIAGESNVMIGFQRQTGKAYSIKPISVPLAEVANFEKKFPLQWIQQNGNSLSQDFIDYAMPLIQGDINQPKENGLPRFAQLRKKYAKVV